MFEKQHVQSWLTSLLYADGQEVDHHKISIFSGKYSRKAGYPKTLQEEYGLSAPSQARAFDFFLITKQLFILSYDGDMYEFSVTGRFIPPYTYSFVTRYNFEGIPGPFGTPPAGIRTMMLQGILSIDGIIAIVDRDVYASPGSLVGAWNNNGTLSWL